MAAYYDCLNRKRNTPAAILFECNRESLLCDLLDEINSRTYTISKSVAFVVTHPKPREIFAPSFKDRIIHHYISLRLSPIVKELAISRTYSCMKGRGTLMAQTELRDEIIRATENYTKDAWIAKFDISGFFGNINKEILWGKVSEIILEHYYGRDKSDLLWLVKMSIYNRPELNCEIHGDRNLWSLISDEKSLFKGDGTKGIAIGKVDSQIYANIYLNRLDHYVSDKFGTGYGRYVDDFYIVSASKKMILHECSNIRKILYLEKLALHPKKFYMQPVRHGCDFIGMVIKYDRIYIRNRTIKSMFQRVSGMIFSEENISVLNSYLGYMKHTNEYAMKRMLVNTLDKSWYNHGYFSAHHHKFVKYKNKKKDENEN